MQKGDLIQHKTENYAGKILLVYKTDKATIEIYDCEQNEKVWGAMLPFRLDVELKYFKPLSA